MGRYGSELLRNIDDPANILPLKVDLHRCFDKRWFAIIPKSTEISASYPPQYITHILLQEAAELWPTYHNTPVQYLHENTHYYLFARFAWAILLQVKPFIIAGFSRHVIRIQMSGEDKINREEKFLNGSQLKAYYGGGGSKRATPLNKRSGTGSMGDDDDDDLIESPSGDGDLDMENDWEDTVGEWRQKVEEGRRQISSENAIEEDNQAHVLAELKSHLEEVLPGGGDDIPQQG
jgi:HNH endonuclease